MGDTLCSSRKGGENTLVDGAEGGEDTLVDGAEGEEDTLVDGAEGGEDTLVDMGDDLNFFKIVGKYFLKMIYFDRCSYPTRL